MSGIKQAMDDRDGAMPKVEVGSASDSDMMADPETQGWDKAATKRLLRKLDWHLIPFMSLIYLFVANDPFRQTRNGQLLTDSPGFASSIAPISAMPASTI